MKPKSPAVFPIPSLPKLIFLLLLLAAGVGLQPTIAATAATNTTNTAQPPASPPLTKDALQAKIDAVTARQDFDDSTKASVLAFYHTAQDNLVNLELFQAKTFEYQNALKQAPLDSAQLQKNLAQAQQKQGKQKLEDFSGIVTEELEQRQIIEQEKLNNIDDQLKKLENELAVQNSRPQLIRQETVNAQQELTDTQNKLAAPDPATNNSKVLAEAESLALQTTMAARTAELKMLGIEALSNPVRLDLLKSQYQWLDFQKSNELPVIAAIGDKLAEHREQAAKDAQDALSLTEKALSDKHPVLQSITRENIQLSKDLQAATTNTESYDDKKTKLDAQVTEIADEFKTAEKKISLAALSPALGWILHDQRRQVLLDIQQNKQAEAVQKETALASLSLFKVEDKQKLLTDIDQYLRQLMAAQVDVNMPGDQRMMIQAQLRVLLNDQKDLLNKLAVADDVYLRTLGDYDFSRQQMVAEALKFADFLNERLLWVPSSEPLDAEFLPGVYHSLLWLLAPVNGGVLLKDTRQALIDNPLLTLAIGFGLIVLLASRSWSKAWLQDIAGQVGKFHSDRFCLTTKALGHVLLLGLPLPCLFFGWGWLLSHTAYLADFSKAVGVGLRAAALPLFFLQFFYRLLAPQGIVRQHFKWRPEIALLLRRQIAWMRFIAVPCVFLMGCTTAFGQAQYSDTLGRLALITVLLILVAFLALMLHPSRGLLQHMLAANRQGWLNQSRYVWYPLALMPPLAILGFAADGYYLSALELQQQLIISLRLMFVLVVVHQLVFRWLTLVNRQLAIENRRQQREIQAKSGQRQNLGGEEIVLPVEENLLDIPKINAQTIKLLHVFISLSLIIGVWLIWKNIFPAFSFLDNITLWEHRVIFDKQDIMQPVTLTNVLLAGLYVFITTIAVLNFSGLMEIMLFRRVDVERGSHYAINKLAKYVLISIGVVSVANELGGSWEQVQWLAAALGVGLGFGLQEIFANLVSGIIILFERPIRVGDTVTIGEVTGIVSRIQMRATTIMDWDQRELVVPNKTFITSQLINWTLSDAITRVVITVNIAYGTDLEQAHELMLATVQATPRVLAEPPPRVVLNGFNDNGLNFSVRVFVSEMAHRLDVTHALHLRLERALRENGIEIPFPQRDVHIHGKLG